MTDEQLAAIEAAAKGATKGEWHCRRKDVFSRTPDGDSPVVYDALYERDANYIAAADPIAVLDLITELRKAKAHIAECNRRLADTLELLNIEPEDSSYAKLSYIYHSVKRLQEELRQARTERYWLARDIAHSARKNWWDERTWTIEYWLARAAKDAVK